MYLVLTIPCVCCMHVVAAPARGGLSVQTMVQNSEPSAPPSLTRSHPLADPIPSHPPRPRHDTWPAGVHARALSSCPSVGWAGPVHPTRSQVPRHEPPSRRDDARRPRRLGFRSIPCWAGPRPHTWWANICSPARDGRERDGTGDNGRGRRVDDDLGCFCA